MGHTYTNCLVHCVFSTKNRQRVLTSEMRARLWPFMGGIARSNGFTALEVGGYVDHAHMLIALTATLPIAKAMQEVKGGSSKFMNETFPGRPRFEWQEGYGAFRRERIGMRQDDYLHSQSGKTPSSQNIRGGVHRFPEKERDLV